MSAVSRSEIAAVACSGLLAGSYLFASAVDARALYALAGKNKSEVLQAFFPVWWPAGRDLMAPLGVTTAAAHVAAYAATSDKAWLATGAAIFGVMPYTILVMGEDITALRAADSEQTCETARRFCWLHHPRSVVAGAVFAIALKLAFTSRSQ